MRKTSFEAVGYGESDFEVLAQMATAFKGKMTRALDHAGLDKLLRELIDLSTGRAPPPTVSTGEYDCRPDPCTDAQMLLKNGRCAPCEEYMRAQGNGRSCGPDQCSGNEQLLKSGRCAECPAYTRAYGKDCTETTCPLDRNGLPTQYLDRDGYCKTCGGYQRPAPDGRSCRPVVCADDEKVTSDGQCVACGRCSRSQAEGRRCAPDSCNFR